MYVLILLTHQTLCAQNKYEFDYETWMRMRIRNISGSITESMFRWSQRSPQLQLNKSRGQIEWMNESNRMQMRLKCIAEFLARCQGRPLSLTLSISSSFPLYLFTLYLFHFLLFVPFALFRSYTVCATDFSCKYSCCKTFYASSSFLSFHMPFFCLSRLLLLMTLMMLCTLAFRTTQPPSAWSRRKLSLIKHQCGAKPRERQLALILLTWLFAQIIRKSSAIEYYKVCGIQFRTWVYSYSYSFSYLLLCFYLCFVFVQLLRLVNIEVYSHTPTHTLPSHTHPPPFTRISLESHVATERTPCGCPDAKFLEFTDSPRSSLFLEIKLNHNFMLSFKYSTCCIWLYDSYLKQSKICFCVILFIIFKL